MLPSVSYYLARLKVDDEACAVIGLHLVQNMMRLHNMIISHIPMVCLKKKPFPSFAVNQGSAWTGRVQ